MEPKENIENLFRDTFNGYEEPVRPELWDSIKSQIPTPSAPSSPSGNSGGVTSAASGAKGGLGLGVWGGAAIVAVTASVLYFASPKEEESANVQNSQSTEQAGNIYEDPSQQMEPSNTTAMSMGEESDLQENRSEENTSHSSNSSAVENNSAVQKRAKNNTPVQKLNPSAPVSVTQSGNQRATDQSDPVLLAHAEKTVVENSPTQQKQTPGQVTRENIPDKSATQLKQFELVADPVKGVAPLGVDLKVPAFHGEVVWEFGDGASGFGGSAISHEYEIPGTYTAWASFKDGDGNTHKEPVLVTVEEDDFLKNFIPNVFTPNGDGINDIFTIRSEQLASVDVAIYDRRGKQVARFTDPELGWNGNLGNGEAAPKETYFYVIYATGNDGKVHNHKGTLKLMR